MSPLLRLNSFLHPADERGWLDTTRFWGLYATARNQGYGRIVSATFAWRQHRTDRRTWR